MTVVEATNLSRHYGKVPAVRNASLSVAAGSVTGLIGPNGSGKTTLLLMLATLIAPDSGQVKINGIDVAADPFKARQHIGWMPDVLGTWASLTVRETLVYSALLHDFSRVNAEARATELIAMLDLQALEKRPARVLSRGQKQRLGLARALVHDPQLLLLDEPAAGLDPAARIHLRDLLRGFAKQGKAILVSSHILAELDELVDNAVFMFEGETLVDPTALLGSPGSAPQLRENASITSLVGTAPAAGAVADVGAGAGFAGAGVSGGPGDSPAPGASAVQAPAPGSGASAAVAAPDGGGGAERAVIYADPLTQNPAEKAISWRIMTLQPHSLEEVANAVKPYRVRAERGGFLVDCPDELSAAAVLEQLLAAGIRTIEFTPTSSRLERAFLQLGNGGVR
ncbi:ABC transporter ATP-binding protein [Leucobacter sp. OH1287]|uniref:ABC transporter ATP-binding protein n=1 Tax=Leucobacter sp. OH1287 TaxID=2491049 RepID=UPI0018F49CB1|nr:ABC transporter ATP-binding protein [Leucobacter sp. OH1287]